MNILVCIKQVPDMESKFKVGGEGTWYDGADLAWRMNEYDEYAVEQAVQRSDFDFRVVVRRDAQHADLVLGLDQRGGHRGGEARPLGDRPGMPDRMAIDDGEQGMLDCVVLHAHNVRPGADSKLTSD